MSSLALDAHPIGIFGGTFDPIHLGHLRTGFELLQSLQLSELRWIPVGNPGHREPPLAAAALRLEMVRVAIAGQPGFVLDEREVRRSGVSYTVDTLEELRAEHPARPLCLVLGMDAFLGLTAWRRWSDILTLAHLLSRIDRVGSSRGRARCAICWRSAARPMPQTCMPRSRDVSMYTRSRSSRSPRPVCATSSPLAAIRVFSCQNLCAPSSARRGAMLRRPIKALFFATEPSPAP